MDSASAEIMICNTSGLSSRILNLFASQDMCDVRLQVGKQTYDAHKLILCASSDVLKTMLTNQKWTEANKQSVVLVEEPMCESVFGRFIHYIYSGQLYLSHSTVCGMLTLADKYNIREMIPLCRSYMMENLDAPLSSSCVLQWWEIANMRSDTELEGVILAYIECNFNKVIQTSDFVNANIETVEKLLASSKLAVHNEATIFCGVMIWLQSYIDCHNPPVNEIQEAFYRVTRYIRWPMLTEDELRCLQQCSEVQRFVSTFSSLIFLSDLPCGEIDHNSLSSCSEKIAYTVEPYKPSVSGCLRKQASHHIQCGNQFLTSCKVLFDLLSPDFMFKSTSSLLEENVKPLKMVDQQDRKLYMSRVYISDYWCTSLTVSNFLAFPQYATQTFFFSTPRTGFRHDDGHYLDWEVELCPKGVHYPPAILIGLERDGNKLVDESFIHTVRLSVMSRSPQELPVKVEVNVLVLANSLSQPGHSFIERCHCRTCIFDSKHQRHNLDDIVPYEKFGTYLRPDCHIPDLYLTPTVAFTVSIVIRPLPFH